MQSISPDPPPPAAPPPGGAVVLDESLLQSLVMAARAAVYVLDGEDRVRRWNGAAEEIFGWSAAQVLGRRDPTVPPEERDAARGLVRGARRGEPVSGCRAVRRRRDGTRLGVTLSAARLGAPGGGAEGVMVVAEAPDRPGGGLEAAHRDLLRRERAAREQAEEAEQQAVRAVQARERMLAVVSHDLRNSLATVLLNASAILESPRAAVAAGARDQLEWIARSAEQMNRLINDLLDVSSIERGRLAVEPAAHQPGRLAREAVEMARPLAAEKGLRCELEVQEGLPPVRVDAGRIQQVLANMLGNAIKFSPTGEEILLRVDAPAPGQVRFCVRDRGPGIAPDHLDSVFDLYWRGRRGRPGAGLGLSIARGIVEAHGGRIWVQSREGEGATFCFTTPVEPDAAAR